MIVIDIYFYMILKLLFKFFSLQKINYVDQCIKINNVDGYY